MKTLYQISKTATIVHHHHHHHHRVLLHSASSINALADVDPFMAHPSHHRLSTIKTKSQLLKSYKVTPPIKEWPRFLKLKDLNNMIGQQKDLDLCLRIFYHAGNYHPRFTHRFNTYRCIIRKLCRARSFEPVETLLSELKTSGIKCRELLFIEVLRSYGLAGRPKDALRIFLQIQDFGVKKSALSLNTLLYVLIHNRKYKLVHALFKSSRRKFNIIPNVLTCNFHLEAFCKQGDIEAALKVLDEMPAMGMRPNLVSYTTILGGCVSKGDMDGANKMFHLILDQGWTPDVETYTILMDGFIKLGRFIDVVRLMDHMKDNKVRPTDVTYGVMIEAFCKEKKNGEALNLLDDMFQKKYIPNSALCCTLIGALCEQGKVEDACYLRKKLLKKHVTPDNKITTTLIHWLCKKGKIWEAKKLLDEFEESSIPSVFTYNALIGGMCEMGELCEACRLWDDMMAKRCVPNVFSYNLLIKGFCKGGNAKEGVKIFKEMLGKKLNPNKSTYSILLTGLCSSGSEAEVMKVIDMDKKREMIDSDVWQLLEAKFGSKVSKKRETVIDSVLVNSAS